jgi:hypothetical protein
MIHQQQWHMVISMDLVMSLAVNWIGMRRPSNSLKMVSHKVHSLITHSTPFSSISFTFVDLMDDRAGFYNINKSLLCSCITNRHWCISSSSCSKIVIVVHSYIDAYCYLAPIYCMSHSFTCRWFKVSASLFLVVVIGFVPCSARYIISLTATFLGIPCTYVSPGLHSMRTAKNQQKLCDSEYNQ